MITFGGCWRLHPLILVEFDVDLIPQRRLLVFEESVKIVAHVQIQRSAKSNRGLSHARIAAGQRFLRVVYEQLRIQIPKKIHSVNQLHLDSHRLTQTRSL
jgi:hypothetical protein